MAGLTQQEIEEYRRIYKKVFGKEITTAEALEQGLNLVNLIRLVAKPNPEE